MSQSRTKMAWPGQMAQSRTGRTNLPKQDVLPRAGQVAALAMESNLQVHKTTLQQEPKYIADSLQLKLPENNFIFPLRQTNTIEVNRKLSLSRAAFIYRGANLWNKLPLYIRKCKKQHFHQTSM